MPKRTSLRVNGVQISLDSFVKSFVYYTTRGMVASLEGTGASRDLRLDIENGTVNLSLDGQPVSTNRFVNLIMTSTVSGMVLPLKGVSTPVKSVTIEIEIES